MPNKDVERSKKDDNKRHEDDDDPSSPLRLEDARRLKKRVAQLKMIIDKNENAIKDHLVRIRDAISNDRGQDVLTEDMANRLCEANDKAEIACDELDDVTERLVSLLPDEANELRDSYAKYSEKTSNGFYDIIPILDRIRPPVRESRRRSTPILELDLNQIAPPILKRDNTSCVAFENWLKVWHRYYYCANRRNYLPPMQAQNLLLSVLDSTLQQKLLKRLTEDTKINTGPRNAIELLREIWYEDFPLFGRRKQFFQFRQRPNQNFRDALDEFLELRKIGELEAINADYMVTAMAMLIFRDPQQMAFVENEHARAIALGQEWTLDTIKFHASQYEEI